MIIEVRMSDDGRVATLFEETRERDDNRAWIGFGWQGNSGVTAWTLTDAEVEDWTSLYRKDS